jgi:hypothetical protein
MEINCGVKNVTAGQKFELYLFYGFRLWLMGDCLRTICLYFGLIVAIGNEARQKVVRDYKYLIFLSHLV